MLAVIAGITALLTVGRPFASAYLPFLAPAQRADLITHKVRYEYLPVTVVERGTLESADNKDVVCKVKAGSRASFSSTIKWVIDDGSMVVKNQLLMELDDSALQDQYRVQSISVEKSRAEWVKADEEYVIQMKTNEANVATAGAALRVAELDVEKYIGLRLELAQDPYGAVAGAAASLVEKGEYRQKLDDVSGRLKLAESDLEAYRDRSSWASRAVRLGYLTASQAKVEQSKLAGALDNVEKLQKERYILETFMRNRDHSDLLSKLEVAIITVDKAHREAQAKLNQAESARKTAYSVYQQEVEQLKEIEDQIRACKLTAPQDGMVVYFKPEGNRFGSSQQGMIAVGEQVKEGQKLMRIPDLKRMQVNTKVHEAMVSRIRGDDRQSTGYLDTLRAALLASPHGFTRLMSQSEYTLGTLREMYRDKEYYLASPGQKASVRVDAFSSSLLQGHVRTVASVASQTDFFSSDVKVYQTLVTIDEAVEGLKPDMSAEVTIQIDPPKEAVLAVPLQAIVGGSEVGPKRKIFVVMPDGPQEREVTLGMFNDKMVEVRDGLQEGEQVVLNPKVIVGDKAKTREEADTSSRRPGGAGGKDRPKGGTKGGSGSKGSGTGGPALKQ